MAFTDAELANTDTRLKEMIRARGAGQS